MQNYAVDTRLSIHARGAIAFLQATMRTSFGVSDVQAAGVGRDRAYRIAEELVSAGYVRRQGRGWAWAELPDFQEDETNVKLPDFQELSPAPQASKVQEVPDFQEVIQCAIGEFPEIQEVSITPDRKLPDFQELIGAKLPESQEVFTTSTTHDLDHDHESCVVVQILQFPEIQEVSEDLIADPNTHPPVAPPPSPRCERKAPAPDAVRHLYPAIFELCGSGQKGGKAVACRNLARDLYAEFTANPEQISAFWEWFRSCSSAGRAAARDQRPLNRPLPKQVYAHWPEFLSWYAARQRRLAPPPPLAVPGGVDMTPLSREQARVVMAELRENFWRPRVSSMSEVA